MLVGLGRYKVVELGAKKNNKIVEFMTYIHLKAIKNSIEHTQVSHILC